jgi:tetratricopeptide (TPR) repeat protein
VQLFHSLLVVPLGLILFSAASFAAEQRPRAGAPCCVRHRVRFRQRRVFSQGAREQTFAVANGNSSELVARGDSLYEKDDYVTAIAAFTKAIWLEPKSASAYVSRAACYEAKGDFDSAIKDCSEAIRLDHTCVDAFVTRGMNFLFTDQYDNTIGDCSEAIGINPRCTDAYVCRSTAWLGKDDYDKAIADSTEAIRLDPKECESAYEIRAGAHLLKGDYNKAIADWMAESRLDSNRGNVRHNLTAIREFMNDMDKTKKKNTEAAWHDRTFSRNRQTLQREP